MKQFYTKELHRLSIGLLIALTLLFPLLLNTAVQAEEQTLQKVKQVIYTFDIPDESLANRDTALGTSQEQLNLPSSLPARVENGEKIQQLEVPVTWTSQPQYDRDTPGEYTFTAAVGEEYVLADDLSAPSVKVIVEEKSDNQESIFKQAQSLSNAEPYQISSAGSALDQKNTLH